MSMQKRMFVAINLPDSIKEKVSGQIIPIVSHNGLKPVWKENLHLTLLFLGAIPEVEIGELIVKLKAVSFAPFHAALKGFSHFDGSVLFIKAEKGAEEIVSLSRKINSALGKNEKCDAHLTIARNKGMQKKEFLEIIDLLGKKNFEAEFEVNSFELVESILMQKGPQYPVVHRFSASIPSTS